MNLQEQTYRIKSLMSKMGGLLSEQENDYLYHGTYEKHHFNRNGMGWYDGTFFSTDEGEAKTYGDYVYKVILKPNLNILDITKYDDSKYILDTFGELTDTYYDEDDPNYNITDPQILTSHSDSWEPLEYTHGLIEWIKGKYDGVYLTEGGIKNLLLFSPINEKLSSISLINEP